jgi:arylsulfatase A-like enzyme
LKNYLYEEAVKVPLLVSWPGHVLDGVVNTTHQVSGLDITPTICSYAGVPTPRKVKGLSLRPLLEGQTPSLWREYVVAEVQQTGRMVRTPGFKYIAYSGDPVEQLFDMVNDPGETVNLAGQSAYDAALEDHRRLLQEWESSLELTPSPSAARHWQRYADIKEGSNAS